MSNELIIRVVLYGGILSGLVTTVALALLWRRHAGRSKNAEQPPRGPVWAVPPLLALGVGIADYVVKQSAELWPHDNTKRVIHAAALIGLLAALESLARLPFALRLVTHAAAFAGATWMLTEGYRPGVLSDAQMWTLIAACAAGGTLLATLADRGLARTTGWTGPAAGLALLAGVQPFLFFAGYATGSLALVGALAVLSGALLVAIFFRRLTLGGGTATMLVGIVLIGLLGAGIQSEPKSVTALLIVALTPAALAITLARPIPTLVVRAGVAGTMIAAGMGLVYLSSGDASTRDETSVDYEEW